MTTQEIINYLKQNGYTQYFGFENILVKNDHSITIESDQILFEQENTGYQDYEDLVMFNTLEEVLDWIVGVEDFIVDEEE
jgi:hypothetical protein